MGDAPTLTVVRGGTAPAGPPVASPNRVTAPPAPPRPGDRRATAALAALTLLAGCGFARVFAQPRWVVPLLVTVVGTHLVAWATRQSRLHPAGAALVDVAAVALLTVWTVVPGSTTAGLPLSGTWHAIATALTQARADFPATIAPVPATTGFVLLAVAGAGLAAVLADWAAFRLRSALQGALPAVALFVVCSVVGTSRGRTWALALVVVGTLVHLLVHRATIERHGVVWFGNRQGGTAGWAPGIGAAATAAAVLCALVVMPALPRSDGHGLLGWKGAGPGSGSSNRSVPSPIVDLRTRLLDQRNTPVFTVRSPVASYWRLTSLDTFTGIQWQSTNSYLGVSRQLPGVQPVTPGSRLVTQAFHIQNLASIWMPTAFNPEAVAGGGQVTWDPVSGSLLAAKATSNGLDYTLTSLEHLGSLSAAQLAAMPARTDPGSARDTELPASVPPAVRTLALQITAGATSEYQRALALQNYFVDNPAFVYSLNPPVDGYGTDALTTFLFTTRTGYCQQFAGAYAVLARSIGIPTRLAVGFTTGQPTAADTYQVLDANAHTWPEVYFGRSVGWLPFEPTKGGGFSIPGATGYTGNTARTTPAPAAAAPSTTPTTTAGATAHPLPHSVPRDATTVAPALRPGEGTSALPVLLGIGAAVAAAGVWIGVNAAGRRLRWRRRRRTVGADRILAAWAEVAEVLAWSGCRRRAAETPAEFAARARNRLRRILGTHADLDRLAPLAEAAGAAAYGATAPDAATVAAALADAGALVRTLEAAAPRSRLLGRLVDPRIAWRGAPVDAPLGLGGPAALASDPS